MMSIRKLLSIIALLLTTLLVACDGKPSAPEPEPEPDQTYITVSNPYDEASVRFEYNWVVFYVYFANTTGNGFQVYAKVISVRYIREIRVYKTGTMTIYLKDLEFANERVITRGVVSGVKSLQGQPEYDLSGYIDYHWGFYYERS